ncbi:C2 calcium-dependent domain-containing protein 4D [Crotalus tigris]|uniref:C2 calcium-dependent domain-containing protein 4D n=1 Tax=Crotalus tigris TaxID=88082 RepID=UPI00192F61AA|nr:C2 calcium-dependent domain-containing protein 4D [Crotalus tigris]XP_039219405.1 C2 calcium-dependent domain-containing protein 4D [Crotalus tigris]
MFSKRKTPNVQRACPNVLTPDTIPSFFIPPNLATLQGRRAAGKPRASEASAPPVKNEGAAVHEGHRAGVRLRGAPTTIQLPNPMNLGCLPESPNTWRRESLFHSRPPPHRGQGVWLSSPQTRPLPQPTPGPDSDTASSTENSPYNSPLPTRPLGGLLPCHGYRPRRRLACRSPHAGATLRPSSFSTEDTSSADTSPCCLRREADPAWISPGAWSLAPLFPLDLMRCHQRLIKEVTLTVSQGGQLRLSSEYLPQQASFRVRLVSAEGFYPPQGSPRHIHCCVALQLRPGLGQRQRSAVIKRTRNPIFNEDFYFEDVSPEDLPRRSLRIKVLNKECSLRRDVVLGECDVPLDSLLP